MTFAKVLYFDRGPAEISALVSAEITVNENKRFELTDFYSDETLRPAELELAQEELIDKARAYAGSGIDNRASFNLELTT